MRRGLRLPRRGTAVTTAILCAALVGCNAPAKAPTSPAAALPTSATAGSTTIVAIAPPPAPAAPPKSLCTFFGLDKIGGAAGELFRRASSRLRTALGLEGRFPGLQPKPPLLPITDPSNLSEDAPPAVKAAAEAKMEEDQAAQKVQALRYLGTIGCGGCYPEIEDAMLAALDDCTEAVRYAAVLALRGDGNTCCAYCKCQGCCSPKVRKKLDEVANGKDAADCFKEPSERVRRMARMVLAACGGYQPGDSPVPTEGPTPAPPAAIEGPTPAPPLGAAPPDGAAPPAAPAAPAAAPPAAAPGSSASTEPAHLRGLSPVQLVSFEQAATTASAYDPAVARIDGEPIFESRVLPWAEAEAARRRAAGAVIDGPAFARILTEQVERAVDARLFLLQAHRESAAAGRLPGPLGPDEVELWLRRKLAVDPYVSVAETEAYHRAHRDRFRAPAQVRWEQISTSVAEAGSRERALELMKYFRDRIAGVDVDPPAVDLRAAFTTTYDYTPLDRIEPAIVANAAATLPVGAAGAVLEERGEFFLVRVLDRRPGAEPPFDELAGRIRTEIAARRRREAEAALLAQLRREHEVWTAHGGTMPAEVGGVVPAAARVEPPSATGLDGEPIGDAAPLGFDAPPQSAELDAAIAPLRLDHFPNFPQPPVASEVAPRRP